MWTDLGYFDALFTHWKFRFVFSILGCMTSNLLNLSFSTLHSSSLGRTDTIVFAKLNKTPSRMTPPPSNVFEMNKPLGGA